MEYTLGPDWYFRHSGFHLMYHAVAMVLDFHLIIRPLLPGGETSSPRSHFFVLFDASPHARTRAGHLLSGQSVDHEC